MSLYDVTLTVGGDVISAFDISEIIIREEFTKARQFEISVLDEARASWTLDEVVVIDYGFASPKRLRGRLEGIDNRGALAILTGRDVSYETLDRPVDKEYTDTEVVAIMKDLIDTYAAGVLTYANAVASASTIGSIFPRRISMLDAFNTLIRYAESVDGDDFIWYLDHDKDLHTFAEGDVDDGRELEWMIEIFDYRRIRDSWRVYDKVTVYGGLDADGVATSGSAGAGSREKIVIDEFLDTDLACSQRAAAELKKASARDVYALTCVLASDGPVIGERVFVSLDPEEIEMGFIVYAVEDHLYSGVTVVEVGESVAGFTDVMIDEHVLDEYMKQIKPGAAAEGATGVTIYTVVGTSGTYSFPDGASDIPEMVKVLSCSAGDKLIVSFDASLKIAQTEHVSFNIEVNGTEIGNSIEAFGSNIAPGTKRWIVSITRAYEIPLDGIYTIKARGYDADNNFALEMYLNMRVLTVRHIKSLVAAAAIKEIWFPLVSNWIGANADIHPSRMTINDIATTARAIPSDFTAITSLLLVMRHGSVPSPENVPLTITISFGSAGEAYNVHTQTTGISPSLLNGVLAEPDIEPNFTALLANLVPADRVYIRIEKTGFRTTDLYGLLMKYT